MSIDKDEREQGWTEEDPGQWTKEQARQDRRFDFAAFLGPESLEDRVTDALDGKDLLQEEPAGSDYVPRRASPDRERGRHEAPGPDPEEEEEDDEPEEEPVYDDGLETRRFDQNGSIPPRPAPGRQSEFRPENGHRTGVNDPPPRPKVVVAEPAPRVVVTPERQYPDTQQPDRGGKGGGKAMKWLIALLLSLAVVALVGVGAIALLPGLGGSDPLASPTPGAGDQQMLPTQIPATPVPTQTVTAPPVVHHTITVTAGSGGSVTPTGAVDVQDGASVTFTITPNEGYELGQLLIDGSPVSVQSSYTFSNVERDHTLYAVFQPVQTAPPPETAEPTAEPTTEPTAEPTAEPTDEPTEIPPGEGMMGDLPG